MPTMPTTTTTIFAMTRANPRLRKSRALPLVVVLLLLLASNTNVMMMSARAQGDDEGVGWNVPSSPQAGLLGSRAGAGKTAPKYVKEIIWMDDPDPVVSGGGETGYGPSSTSATTTGRRPSGSASLLRALESNELADGGVSAEAFSSKSLLYQPSGAEGTITLSRDVIPLLLQTAKPEGANAESVPASVEDLLTRREQERREWKPEPVSYASASSTESWEHHRPSFAFDDNPDTVWVSRPWTSDEDKPQWIEYSFDAPRRITSYSLASFPAVRAGRDAPKSAPEATLSRLGGAVFGGPTAWAFKCSKDGIDWFDLHNEAKAQPWLPGEKRAFNLKSQYWWNYCRIYVLDVPKRADGSMQAALSEVTFGSSAPAQALAENPRQTKSFGKLATTGVALRTTPERTFVPKASQCAFPFVHNGVQHNKCIPFQDQRWCKSRSEQWVVCSGEMETERDGGGPEQGMAQTQSKGSHVVGLHQMPTMETLPRNLSPGRGETGTQVAEPQLRQCKFPFLHFGALHYSCVTFQGRDWCKDQHQRWLTCKGGEDTTPFVGTNKRPAPTAASVNTGQDLYLSFDDQGDVAQATLNVLEMKPRQGNEAGADAIGYDLCKITDTADFKLYVPSEHTTLPLGDDEAARIQLPDKFAFPFFGEEYGEIFVGSNGYVTFDAPDTNFMASEDAHLSRKRISVLFGDLDPSDGGEVQFADLNTAVAITWSNVTLNQNDQGHQRRIPGQTFQTILFEDGTIWMGFQEYHQSNSTVIGLSSGNNVGLPHTEAARPLGAIKNCE